MKRLATGRWLARLAVGGAGRRLRVSRQRHGGARPRRRLHRQGRRARSRSSTTSPAWPGSAARACCFDANLVFHTYEFQRAGIYPVGNNPAPMPLAYGGQPYPEGRRTSGAVLRAVLRPLDRFRLLRPLDLRGRRRSARRRTATRSCGSPVTVDGKPGTAALRPGADQPAHHLSDARGGGAGHQVARSRPRAAPGGRQLRLSPSSLRRPRRGRCARTPSTRRATRRTTCSTTGVTATRRSASMFHPPRAFAIGVNLRGPPTCSTPGHRRRHAAVGEADPDRARARPTFHTELPWVLRVGLRYAFLGATTSSTATSRSTAPMRPGAGRGRRRHDQHPEARTLHRHQPDAHPPLPGHLSACALGGAYNIRLPAGVLTFRLGVFFDSAATNYEDTRLDFDTMAKYGRRRASATASAASRSTSPTRICGRPIARSPTATSSRSTPSPTARPDHRPARAGGQQRHYHARHQILSIGLNRAGTSCSEHRKTHDWD